VRGMVHDHIHERGAGFLESGAGLRALVRAGKVWVIAYHECIALAADLPREERRAELERLTWEAVKKAHEFIHTEEPANKTKHRILAIEAIALITRAQEQILAHVDKAEVDQIVQRIEAALNVMDKAAGQAPAKKTKTSVRTRALSFSPR